MAEFRYRALDSVGRSRSDTIEAGSLHEAAELLREREVDAVAIEAIESAPRRFEPTGAIPPSKPRNIDVPLKSIPGGWVLALIGAVFTSIAAVFMTVGLVALANGASEGLFFLLFPLIHLTVGIAMLVYGLGRRAKRRHIYREGDVTMGTIEGVGYNRSIRVNRRNPYELVWSFEVAGHRYHDKHSTFDEQVMQLVPGDRIWVIYDPSDPEESVEWPPLG